MTGKMNSDAGVTDPPDNSDAAKDGFPMRLKAVLGSESARAFARRAGLSDTFLRQCLKGQSEPTRPMLISMADAGGVRLEWLATGKEPMRKEEKKEAAPIEAIDRRTAALLGLLADLDREQREAILSACLSRAQTAQQMNELRQTVHDLEVKLRQAS